MWAISYQLSAVSYQLPATSFQCAVLSWQLTKVYLPAVKNGAHNPAWNMLLLIYHTR